MNVKFVYDNSDINKSDFNLKLFKYQIILGIMVKCKSKNIKTLVELIQKLNDTYKHTL